VPKGPGFPDENNLRLFNSLIYSAQRRLSITSPYFVPDESLLYAITTAAQRGIDVELFVVSRVISSWSTTRSALTTKRC
jgi:cardiolipin synthase